VPGRGGWAAGGLRAPGPLAPSSLAERVFEDAAERAPRSPPRPRRTALPRSCPKVDLQLQDHDFWDSLHGQVPGLLDWDMGNDVFLDFTTAHLPPAEQKRELEWARWGMGVGSPGRGGPWQAAPQSPPSLAPGGPQGQAHIFGVPRPPGPSSTAHLAGPTRDWGWRPPGLDVPRGQPRFLDDSGFLPYLAASSHSECSRPLLSHSPWRSFGAICLLYSLFCLLVLKKPKQTQTFLILSFVHGAVLTSS
jgi:hypothetical protein